MRFFGGATTPTPDAPAFAIAGKTPQAGVALINGVQTFVTVNVPNDGQPHLFGFGGYINVTGIQTGGALNINWTSGGQAQSFNIFAGGSAIGVFLLFLTFRHADPGTTITMTQTAQTAGAATATGVIALQ